MFTVQSLNATAIKRRDLYNHYYFAAALSPSSHLGNPISIESSTNVDTDNDFSKH